MTGPLAPTPSLLFCWAAALLITPMPRTQRRARACGVGIVWSYRVRIPTYSARYGLPVLLGIAAVVLVAGGIGIALTCAIALATLRRLVVRARCDHDAARQRALLADLLAAVIAELRVGAHPATAADSAVNDLVAQHTSADAGGQAGDATAALRRAAGRSRLGGDAAAGIRQPESLIAADLDRVANAWSVAEQHGLALAELLATARQDLLDRLRFRSRLYAALAGARASAMVLAGLPVLGIGLGELMGAQPLRLLLSHGLGAALLVIGVGLTCAGLLWTEILIHHVTDAVRQTTRPTAVSPC